MEVGFAAMWHMRQEARTRPVLVRNEERSIVDSAFALNGPLQDAALAVILQCDSPEMPRCGFYCRKTFSSSTWPC